MRMADFKVTQDLRGAARARSRRGPTAAALLVGFWLCPSLTALAASQGPFGEQAEWAQRYDADPRLAVSRSITPSTLAGDRGRHRTGDRDLSADRRQWRLGHGSRDTRAETRRQRPGRGRAAQTARGVGRSRPSAGASPIFNSYVDAAVKHFQARHGLLQSGIVSKETFTALNIPADMRLHQLEINLVRLRSYSGNLGERFVMANIPAMAVETVENGVVVTHHEAGVGKIDRQSPVMMTKAIDINFNPYWTVPASIIRKDLIPRMQKDPII